MSIIRYIIRGMEREDEAMERAVPGAADFLDIEIPVRHAGCYGIMDSSYSYSFTIDIRLFTHLHMFAVLY